MQENYPYTDRVSNVSINQLMALAWIAIHDKTARIGTFGDAKQQLIEGLYEIQRGGNLSESGVDNNAQDSPICTSGTFNKLCEKLAGLHPYVLVIYITKAGMANKLPIVAIEEAQDYLNKLEVGSEEYLALQDNISKEDMQPVWDKIESEVRKRLFDEFGSLFPYGIDSPSFVEIVAQGIDALEIKKLILPTASTQTSVANNRNMLFQASDASGSYVYQGASAGMG
jgi:hypothetical protein